MKYWFTSDYHLGHANIIKYCQRPFKDLWQMNATIIRNHNARIKPEDTVFFLGDFCFKNTSGGKEGEGENTKAEEYIKQLNGRIVFIQGNHDNNNSLNTPIMGALINLGGKSMWLCHNPRDAEDFVDVNICGHVHQNWVFRKTKQGTPIINVGIDVNHFMPIDLNELLAIISKFDKKNTPVLSDDDTRGN